MGPVRLAGAAGYGLALPGRAHGTPAPHRHRGDAGRDARAGGRHVPRLALVPADAQPGPDRRSGGDPRGHRPGPDGARARPPARRRTWSLGDAAPHDEKTPPPTPRRTSRSMAMSS